MPSPSSPLPQPMADFSSVPVVEVDKIKLLIYVFSSFKYRLWGFNFNFLCVGEKIIVLIFQHFSFSIWGRISFNFTHSEYFNFQIWRWTSSTWTSTWRGWPGQWSRFQLSLTFTILSHFTLYLNPNLLRAMFDQSHQQGLLCCCGLWAEWPWWSQEAERADHRWALQEHKPCCQDKVGLLNLSTFTFSETFTFSATALQEHEPCCQDQVGLSNL